MKIKRWLPLYGTLKTYYAKDWRKDVLAGIVVAVMIIPQGMAYALLAGIPPIYGLYAGLIPLIIYGIFGTSGQLAIGPVAISSILLLAGVSQLADPMTSEYISLIILTGLLVGIFQAALGLFRLGFLVNFISQPVITGFTGAAAVIIFISQIRNVTGIPVPRFSYLYETVYYSFHHLLEMNRMALLFCVTSILALWILKKINRALPGALIVVVIGIIVAWWLSKSGQLAGMRVVGEIPDGLPSFILPELSIENALLLIPTVITVGVMGVVECIGIAKTIQRRHEESRIRPDMELIALGLSKIGGSFFQSLPTSGSFSRSAINDEAGAKSGLSSITTGLVVGLTLLFFTKLFYYLPNAVLAAIIIFAIRNLFDYKEMQRLWKSHKTDFVMMAVTFVVTLIFGIEKGVLVGVALSLAVFIYRSSRPHLAVLGRLPNSQAYRNVERFEDAHCPEDVLIMRLDYQLYFANVIFFQDAIQNISKTKKNLRLIILDAAGIHAIDSTGIRVLRELFFYFKKRNIHFVISGSIGPVRDKMASSGTIEEMGAQSFFLEIHDAMIYFGVLPEQAKTTWSADAVQTNYEEED